MKYLSTVPVPLSKAKERAIVIIKREHAFHVQELNQSFIVYVGLYNIKQSKKFLVKLKIVKPNFLVVQPEDHLFEYEPKFKKLPFRLQLYLGLHFKMFGNPPYDLPRVRYSSFSHQYDFAEEILKIDLLDTETIQMTLTDYNLLFN